MHYLPLVAALDKIEAALGKFTDGPFFLGQFSLVCRISLRTLQFLHLGKEFSQKNCGWHVFLLRMLISAQVDIAYAPFIERFQIFFSGIKNYDITKGRPNLQKFVEVILNNVRCDYAIYYHVYKIIHIFSAKSEIG
jgi:glutathione S-transferase